MLNLKVWVNKWLEDRKIGDAMWVNLETPAFNFKTGISRNLRKARK